MGGEFPTGGFGDRTVEKVALEGSAKWAFERWSGATWRPHCGLALSLSEAPKRPCDGAGSILWAASFQRVDSVIGPSRKWRWKVQRSGPSSAGREQLGGPTAGSH